MVATIAPSFELLDPQAILNLLPHGVLVVSRDWRITYSNPEADRMLGTTGATLWERCPALEHTAFASGFRYAMADRTELLTESVVPSVGWCQARARPVADGGMLVSLRQVHAHTIETGQARAALLLGEIGDALTREDSLRAALKRCAAGMVRHLDAAVARIWTVDEAAETMALCATAGLDTGIASDTVIGFGDHRVGQIAARGEPYLTNDVATDPEFGTVPWLVRERIAAFAGYPLRIEDRIIGVMTMFSRRKLDHDSLNGLSAIADALALGIESKTALEARRVAEAALRKHAADLEVMNQLGQQLTAVLEPAALAQKVIDATTRLAGAQAGVFFYPSGEGELMHAAAGNGAALVSVLAPLAGQLRDATRALHLADARGVANDLLVAHPAVASCLALPVLGRRGGTLGVLVFADPRPLRFTEETERVLTGVATTAAIALDNAQLFAEARALIAALEKSNRELDQFAYVASHDLKAPLRGIANLSQWIEDDLGDRLDEQSRSHLDLLRGRVVRLENLIGGILAYSRAGREAAVPAVVDVSALLDEVWELLAPPATATLHIATPLPVLRTSRVQLQQIFLNLIGNALKYNPDRPLTITIAARGAGKRWELLVADDGIGIAPEFSDKIWGLFQTLERRDKIESTGIGLSVVRKIVESHGGRAWVESALGSGATFAFTWTAEGEIPAPTAALATSPSAIPSTIPPSTEEPTVSDEVPREACRG